MMTNRHIKTAGLLVVVLLTATEAAVKSPVLREGLALAGTEGVCKKELQQNLERWVFYPSAAIVDGKTVLPAETGLEILPSAGLAQIRSFAGDKTLVKVWAVLTAYRGRNFLFPLYALPLTTAYKPAESPQKQIEPAAVSSDPNRSPVIPSEILKLLKPAGRVDLARIAQSAAPKGDSALVGKTGLISVLHNSVVFNPDGFGKKTENVFYSLLPCQTLERTQERLGRAFARQRFNVSGIVTVHDGRRYLLLYRTERTYTNGNFTP